MNDLVLNLRGVEVVIKAEDERALFDVMREHSLISEVSNKYYFSRSNNKWEEIDRMATPYLVNAISSRLRDVLDEVRKNPDNEQLLYIFDEVLASIQLNCSYSNPNLKQLYDVVQGLLEELSSRVHPDKNLDLDLPF